jgi:hypothetical protein
MVQGKEAGPLRCACGHAILCEVRRLGEHLSTLAFFDDEATSETHTKSVESCPGCGKPLDFLMLLLKNRRR